jgi:hypothetical protein
MSDDKGENTSFDFIHYDLARDQELLAKLDNAIQNTLGGDYEELLEHTVALQKFNADTSSQYSPASLEEFRARTIRGERNEGIPAPNGPGFAEFVLPKVSPKRLISQSLERSTSGYGMSRINRRAAARA